MLIELREYRCDSCQKLLCKGLLNDVRSVLEVKCRGCGKISNFVGPDASIIKARAILIKEGLIPDPE